MSITISFRLELIPPRGWVSHSDSSSPLQSITSGCSFCNRESRMSAGVTDSIVSPTRIWRTRAIGRTLVYAIPGQDVGLDVLWSTIAYTRVGRTPYPGRTYSGVRYTRVGRTLYFQFLPKVHLESKMPAGVTDSIVRPISGYGVGLL